MRASSSPDDAPRQALQPLLREWVLSLSGRGRWRGTYAEFASELHSVRAATRVDLGGLRFIPQSRDSIAAVLVDASMFTRLGWSVAIGEDVVLFSRSG
jgi:hypothetical protein